ncbi:MAG: hypothetical protein JKY37_27320 [Nannocystaceae bacterium]|nr:hypothetical protein [Nannocystaceae bacterium]
MEYKSLKLKLGMVVAALSVALLGCDDQDGAEDTAGDDATNDAGTDDAGTDDGATDGGDDGVTDGGDDGADDADSDVGDDDGSDTSAEPEHVDLFGCGLPTACDPIIQHIDPEPPEAVTCASDLAQSGAPGVLDALDTPGPDINETQTLTIFLGDGTAVIQSRRRSCFDLDVPPGETECPAQGRPLPWEPVGPHRLCTVTVSGPPRPTSSRLQQPRGMS